MKKPSLAILHYTLPSVVGGLEAVILSQAWVALQAGYSVTLIAGHGKKAPLPPQCDLELIPEVDTLHTEIAHITKVLIEGHVPTEFEVMVNRLVSVTVSQRCREELANLLNCAPEKISLVYNGFDPASILGFPSEGLALVNRLGLLEIDLILNASQ